MGVARRGAGPWACGSREDGVSGDQSRFQWEKGTRNRGRREPASDEGGRAEQGPERGGAGGEGLLASGRVLQGRGVAPPDRGRGSP